MEKRGRKKNCEDGVDKISNLPDPVLHMILSGLPTSEEIVRTSILSKRWRYLWTSVSFIDIDYSRGLKPLYEFEEFVDRVLANQSFDLDSFRLSCLDYCEMSTIERWILAALKKKVVSVDLMFCPVDVDLDLWERPEDIEWPKCPVICDSLEVLRLFSYRRPIHLRYFGEFKGLRVLELNNVEVFFQLSLSDIGFCDWDNLEDLSLIDCSVGCYSFAAETSCSNLKSLRIINRKKVYTMANRDNEVRNDIGYAELDISCPKLVFFEFADHGGLQLFLRDSDSLKEAIIHSEGYDSNYMCYFMGLLLLRVESLSISLYYVLEFIETEGSLSLPNLKTLKLTTTYDSSPNDAFIQFLISNLISLPVLESLHLIFKESNSVSGYWKLEEVETTRILTRHLKTVKFIGFSGEKPKLDIARALLEHGNALEEMVFVWDNKAKYHKKSTDTMKKLSNFHKASSTVKLSALLEG